MQWELEIRCKNCNKLLGKGQVLILSIKCSRCKTINHMRAVSSNKELNSLLELTHEERSKDQVLRQKWL